MIELLEGSTVRGTWPDAQVPQALEGFWKRIFDFHASPSTWFRTVLRLPGKPDVSLPNDELAVSSLFARRYETDFVAALVKRHLELVDRPLELGAFLSLPVRLPDDVASVLEVLRNALSISLPLVHLGSCEKPRPASPGDRLSVTHSAESYPNGAGTVTDVSDWHFQLRGPLNLDLRLSCSSEYTSVSWSRDLLHEPTNVSLQPLMDAFKERDVSVQFKPTLKL